MPAKENNFQLPLVFKTTVCYEANEAHDEDTAIQYVLDNCMKEIKEAIRRSIYVDDIIED